MIIKENNINIDLNKVFPTRHLFEREERMNIFLNNSEKFYIVKAFWVNKGHPNGPEIHCILNNAVILILNARTFKLITILFARVGQIQRYYKVINVRCPQNLIEAAKENEITQRNKI